MVTFRSTCKSCSDELTVTISGQETHSSCPDSSLEELQARFVDAVNAEDDETAAHLSDSLDALDRIRPTLRNAALAYAGHGWPVLPLRPGAITPMTRHGVNDATTDENIIRGWWRANPHANIGLATGHAFDVLTVTMPIGTMAWVELRESSVLDHIDGMVNTPDGIHVYLEPTGGGNLANLRPGLHYRGTSGYVVAPPSELTDGRRWSWAMRPSPTLTAGVPTGGAA